MLALPREILLHLLEEMGVSVRLPRGGMALSRLLRLIRASGDPRLLEELPALLAAARSAQGGGVSLVFDQEGVRGLLTGIREHREFGRWLTLGIKILGRRSMEGGERVQRLVAELVPDREREAIHRLVDRGEPVELFGFSLSPQRMVERLDGYRAAQRRQQGQAPVETAMPDRLLARLFSPRQRELLQKKLSGELLSKTEREYYSRIVKKRLVAIVDPEVQQMALRLIRPIGSAPVGGGKRGLQS